MATIAHIAAGLAAGRIPAGAARRARAVQVAFGVLALLPDLDRLIPGLRHDGPVGRLHAPVVSIVGSAIAAECATRRGLPRRGAFLASLVALGSQPVFDTLTHGKGLPALWPISGRHYGTKIPGLPTWKPEEKSSGSGVRSLVGELAWSLPMLVIAALPLAGRKEPSTPSRAAAAVTVPSAATARPSSLSGTEMLAASRSA